MAKADNAPKKIAGLKLPKAIRQAPAIKALLATPAGRKLLGDALMEGAAFAAAKVMEAHLAGQATAAAKPAKSAPKVKKPAPTAPVAVAKPTSEPDVSSAPASSPPKAVAPAAIAAAPPKPPASTPEPFKTDVPVTAKPPLQVLDDKVGDDAPSAKSNAAE